MEQDGADSPSAKELCKQYRERFVAALRPLGDSLLINAEDVKTDLLVLEQVFADPSQYGNVLLQIAAQLSTLCAQPHLGKDLKGPLAGWRKHKISSGRESRADLRILFRRTGQQIELLGFGHRDEPYDVYRFVGSRVAEPALRQVSAGGQPPAPKA